MRLILLTAALLLGAVTAANAGPFVAAIGAAISAAFTIANIVNSILMIGLSFGLSYVASVFLKPDEPRIPVGGARLDLQADAKVPRNLILGRAVVAGSLVYGNTWNNPSGEAATGIANAHLVEIIALADHPVHGLVKAFCDGKEAPTSAGAGGEVNLTDYTESETGRILAKYKFFDGTQTAADSDTVDIFGTAARPWTSKMVGKNVAYARINLRYDREKITGPLSFKWVVDGIHLYDPRKDTSVGGFGGQRFDDPSTHAFTTNPMVMAYNVLRGIYVGGQFFYGLEGTDAAQLPLTIWTAAMDKCDETFHSLLDDADIKKYEVGGEIPLDTEPMELIKELFKSCGGRFVEIGGTFLAYVDTPAAANFTFTDDDLVADQAGGFKPILPLQSRINYITGSYTSPKKWSTVDAVPQEDAAAVAADGRRIPFDIALPMVQHGSRVQRLLTQIRKRAKRERRHTETLWHKYFEVEPGHVMAWTSARHGYSSKLFTVETVGYHGNGSVTVALTEIDPSDYDWTPETDEKPVTDGDLKSTLPAPKVVAGFAALAVTVEGDKKTKKPGIQLSWSDPDDGDAETVRWQLRRADQPSNVVKGESEVADLSVVIVGGLAPQTDYEVRARFSSREGYPSSWSLWIPVTTTAAYLTMPDFAAEVRTQITDAVRDAHDKIARLNDAVGAVLAQLLSDTELLRASTDQQIRVTKNDVVAAFNRQIAVAVGDNSAIGQLVEQLDASVGDIRSSIKAQWVVGVTPSGAVAAYDLTTVAENAKAGLQIASFDDGSGNAFGQVRIEADRFFVGSSEDNVPFRPLLIVNTQTRKVLINGDLVVDSLLAASAKIGRLSAISADLGTVTAGRMRFMATGGGFIDITSNPPRILIDDGQ